MWENNITVEQQESCRVFMWTSHTSQTAAMCWHLQDLDSYQTVRIVVDLLNLQSQISEIKRQTVISS